MSRIAPIPNQIYGESKPTLLQLQSAFEPAQTGTPQAFKIDSARMDKRPPLLSIQAKRSLSGVYRVRIDEAGGSGDRY